MKIDGLKLQLQLNRSEVLRRGHSWDVADVMAILESCGVTDGEETVNGDR